MPTGKPPTTSTPLTVNYATPTIRPRTDIADLSKAALVASLVGFIVPLAGVIGVFIGVSALLLARRNGARPGARVKVAILLGVLNTAVFFSIGAFLYHRVREGTGRIHCTIGMRQIGIGIYLYANDHQKQYPPDLATVLATQDLLPGVFVCPSTYHDLPSTPFTDDVTARSRGLLDYVYTGEGLTNAASPDEPVLFERLSDHGHDGGNVLFGDGHVEFISKPAILKLLEPLRNTPRLTQEEYDAITAK